jgi:hypothetical protein
MINIKAIESLRPAVSACACSYAYIALVFTVSLDLDGTS